MPRQKKTEPKQTTAEPEKTQTKPEKVETNATQVLVKPLAGEKLLLKVKELESLSKSEKAKKCGYYTVKKNGSERVNMMQFLNALIEAEGIELDSTNGDGHGGRRASYRVGVQSNGNVLVGSAYTKQLGLKPGDEFEIALGRKHIHLKQIEAASSETAAPAIAS